jgi:NAD(P)-dependent dehydrogenase (short-subunit alcohol dehydrogenase family)
MSLDGFIAGPGDAMDWVVARWSDGGEQTRDLEVQRSAVADAALQRAGAILGGRRRYDAAVRQFGGYDGIYGGRWTGPVIVLALPVMRPLQHQTWETFSVNWQTDVKIAFTWLREALLQPLPPGSRVVVVSSGAALGGSPASGGYAGVKATQRFIAAYAQEESRRAGLGITVTAVLPRMTPFGDVGRRGVRAYAARRGQTEAAFLE